MMPARWEQYQAYIREHERTFIAEFLPLFEQPSVSHQATDVRHCAELLRDLLQHEGVHAEIMETGGNPVVYGEMVGERDDVTVDTVQPLRCQTCGAPRSLALRAVPPTLSLRARRRSAHLWCRTGTP